MDAFEEKEFAVNNWPDMCDICYKSMKSGKGSNPIPEFQAKAIEYGNMLLVEQLSYLSEKEKGEIGKWKKSCKEVPKGKKKWVACDKARKHMRQLLKKYEHSQILY